MPGETGSEVNKERTPPSAADILRWQKEDLARRASKGGKKSIRKVDYHLSLDEYDPDKKRRRHVPGSFPLGTSTAGQCPPRPGEFSDTEEEVVK